MLRKELMDSEDGEWKYSMKETSIPKKDAKQIEK